MRSSPVRDLAMMVQHVLGRATEIRFLSERPEVLHSSKRPRQVG